MAHGRHQQGKVVVSVVVSETMRDNIDKLTEILGHKDRAATVRAALNNYLESHDQDLRNYAEVQK